MKKSIIALVLALLIIGLGLGLAYAQRLRQDHTYITIQGGAYRRDTQTLTFIGEVPEHPEDFAQLPELREVDLRKADASLEEYQKVCAALPDCRVLWSVPFQQGAYSPDTTELTITRLSLEDIPMLEYFSGLTAVHAEGCRDYDALEALISQRPDLQVTYTVPLGGTEYPRDTRELTLTDADITELAAAVPRLPGLTHVTLEGKLPEAEGLLRLREENPQVDFYWQVELYGVTADVHTTELDLSGIPMDSVDQVEAAAAYLPSLEKLLMFDCGIPDEEMYQLNQRHEGPLFVWNVVLNRYITLRSDATYFAPVQYSVILDERSLQKLKYCSELVALDLGHMELWNCEWVTELTKLEYLIIVDCHIRDISPLTNLKNLKFLEMFMTDVTDYTPLLELTNLQDLNISYTRGDPEILMQMTWLKRLWWAGSALTNDQLQALRDALPGTEIVLPMKGSTDDGWRQGQLYYDMRDIFGMPYLD